MTAAITTCSVAWCRADHDSPFDIVDLGGSRFHHSDEIARCAPAETDNTGTWTGVEDEFSVALIRYDDATQTPAATEVRVNVGCSTASLTAGQLREVAAFLADIADQVDALNGGA